MNKYLWNISYRHAFFLMLCCGAIMAFLGVHLHELESGDETRVAGIAAEMFLEGDYLLPRLNHQPFVEYPPLYYWSQSLFFAIFGVNDFASIVTSAFWALGSALLVFFMARRMNFPPWVAGASGIILMSSAQFIGNTRRSMVDIALAFFILFAINAFHGLYVNRNKYWKSLFLVLFAVGICGGILTKGLIGLVMPIAVLGCWLVAGDILMRKFSWANYLFLGLGMAIGMAGAGIWYYLIYHNHGWKMLDETLITNNFERFSGEQKDHADSFHYYILNIQTLFWPWLLLLFVAFYQAFKAVKAKSVHSAELLLLLSFILIPFIILSIASAKRIVYLLPLYAPCALLCGYCLFNFPEILKPYLPVIFKYLKPLLIGAAFIFFAVMAFLSSLEAIIYPILGALCLLAVFYVRAAKYKLTTFCLCFALGVASIHTMASYYINKNNSLRPLFEECRTIEKSGGKIVLASPQERTNGAAYFYLHRDLPVTPDTKSQPPEGEYWLYRTKSGMPGKKFNDHHYLVSRKDFPVTTATKEVIN